MQLQQPQGEIGKTNKSVTFQPFSTIYVHGFTRVMGYGMRLNLIAEPIPDSQIANSILCSPTSCN